MKANIEIVERHLYFYEIIVDDTSFVMVSKRQSPRRFFEPPRIPSNFLPRHIPIYPNISQMPLNIKQFGEKMNHLQRAKFLGEVIFYYSSSFRDIEREVVLNNFVPID